MVEITAPLSTNPTATIVAGDGYSMGYVRADRQTRSAVAAIRGDKQMVYFRPGLGDAWQTISIPQAVYDSNLANRIEVIAGPTALPNDQINCSECLYHGIVGRPIDTRSGNLWTRALDLQLESAGVPLVWHRVYNSQLTADSSARLGAGWTHTYSARFNAAGVSGNDAGVVSILDARGNRLRYHALGSGFAPFPGVTSSLVQSGAVYTQTLSDQSQYVFDGATGRLTAMRDARGQRALLTYDASGRLTQVSDANNTQRSLTLTYTASNQIATVSDGTRTVQYHYHATTGDLIEAVDVMGRTTTYSYQGHLLTSIVDPAGRVLESTTYDQYTPTGKAIQQTLEDGQSIALTYLANTTIITTTTATGQQQVRMDSYGTDNVLSGIAINNQPVYAAAADANYHPRAVSDGNGQIVQTTFNQAGRPLTQIDAFGQTTQTIYDSQNRPITTTNALGVSTAFQYDTRGNLLRLTEGITTTSSLRRTTIYTYTYDVRYPGESQLTEQRAPDGVLTRYTYTSSGQLDTITTGYGTALAQTTSYGYDSLGRVTRVTSGVGTALERQDRTSYNPDNTVAETIQNYRDGVFDPAHPDADVRTTYGYDAAGRLIWTRDPLGRYQATRYNAAGQVEATVRNLLPLQLDAQGQPVVSAFNPALPDRNVATWFAYDGFGRTTLVTETGSFAGAFDPLTRTFSQTATRTTRTEYDELGRPITVTLNYRPGVPASADTNVQILTHYDGAGNVTWQRDAYGRWTKTEYDALSRPVRTIQNYEDGNPLTGARDADIISETRYRRDGQVDRQITNVVDGVFTATAPITDRITLFDYDTLGRPTATTQNWAPGYSDTDLNRTTTTAYDPTTGRVQGQQDALGRWVSQQYDALGRTTVTVQNCRDGGGAALAQGCVSYSSSAPDRNVRGETRYDALGRVYETVDNAGSVTRTSFDDMGRVTATTQHYVDGVFSSAAPDTDVTSTQTYDALGQVTTTSDPTGATIFLGYDALGHTTVVTDTVGRVTRSGFDGAGAQRWSLTPDGRLTVYELDGLGRVVTMIVNYRNGVHTTADAVDEDLITRTVYDAAGRRTQAIDASGRTTQFAYDNLDRLIAVTENVRSDCAQLPSDSIDRPCNVITRYEYDRVGNRTAIIDANGHKRTFGYDAADQMIAQTDALGQVTSWEYDRGGRPTVQRDPRGSAYDLTYQHDDLDRPTRAESAQLTAPIVTSYDALGRRSSLIDTTGTTSFAYDALGRMTSLTAPQTGTVGYGYSARGERTRLTYPDGTVVGYDYAPDGQLAHVTQGAATLATYTYDPAGRLDSVLRLNGALTTYAYDGADRLRDLHTTVQGETVSRFQYTVDERGMRRSVTETFGQPAPSGTATPTSTPATSPTPSATGTTTPTPTGTFYRAINLGGGAITIDGHAWEGSTASNYTTNGSTLCNEWITWNPSTDSNRATMLGCWVQHWAHQLELTSVPSGSYDVYLYVQQDWDDPNAQAFTLEVEGTSAGGWTPGAAGSWAKLGPFRRSVSDGTILVTTGGMANLAGIEVWAAGNTSSTSTPTATSTPTPQPTGSTTFYRAINLGGSAVTIDGHAWEGSTASNYTTNGSTLCNEWITWNPSTDSNRATMLGCWVQHWAHQLELTSVPSGSYDVYLYVQQDWDDPNAQAFTLEVEGTSAGGWTPGAAGSWAKLGPFRRSVSDGTILITTGGMANIAGVEVWSVGMATATPTATAGGATATATSTPTATSTAGGGASVTRAVTYDYDGLGRLVRAVESPGTSYAYGYDLAGNRTSVTINGVTTSLAYNAAGQVIGWQYDAAGNLLSDGATTYTYDALGRVLTTAQGGVTRTNSYNGDGTLVAQQLGSVTTRYVQDLASPLSQVLSDGSQRYIYGLDRLAGVSGAARTWYSGDALGSVRLTLSDSGTPLATTSYDPWGTPQQAAIAPFGYTGELQDATGLVQLRARWYNPGTGTFTSWRWFTSESNVINPYSHHPYAYSLSNPVSLTDPTGQCVPEYFEINGVRYQVPGGESGCVPIPICYVWEPNCKLLVQGGGNWADAKPWAGASVDFTPVVGDVKGLIEVFTGCDIVTGEDLGVWRWSGLLFVSELRQLRHVNALPAPRLARELRLLPGIASGGQKLPTIRGQWLRGTEGNVGVVPKQVADKLRGRRFETWDEFRREFWKAVAANPNLAAQFDRAARVQMQNGQAPKVVANQRYKGSADDRYILHHRTPINQGGGVYDLDNILIVTPRYHQEVLSSSYHYGGE